MRQKYSPFFLLPVTNINQENDISHIEGSRVEVVSTNKFYSNMYFSKSFGYALRGILYVALMNDENRNIQIEEIASRLSVPRHFLGKILKAIVKQGILASAKGPHGGFSITKKTLTTKLITLVFLIEGKQQFDQCALHFRKCNTANPCPLHTKVEEYRKSVMVIFGETTIGDMVAGKKPEFIRSIAAD